MDRCHSVISHHDRHQCLCALPRGHGAGHTCYHDASWEHRSGPAALALLRLHRTTAHGDVKP